MLKLHYAPNASSLAPHIALEEAGAKYETVKVDFSQRQQQSAEFLGLNPKGRVPVLETDRGVLTENAVILGWIAQMFPDAHLKPPGDFFAFSEMQIFNIYLSSSVHPAYTHLFRPERYADGAEAIAAIKAKVPQLLASVLGLIEERLADGRPWVMGEHYTVADPYLLVFTRWLDRPGTGGAGPYPRLTAHRQRMNARPAVQKVLADEGIAP